MPEQQGYDEVVRCLETYGYQVIPDTPGYIVRHRSDPHDISRARHLDDLIDLSELVEWRGRRRGHGTPAENMCSAGLLA